MRSEHLSQSRSEEVWLYVGRAGLVVPQDRSCTPSSSECSLNTFREGRQEQEDILFFSFYNVLHRVSPAMVDLAQSAWVAQSFAKVLKVLPQATDVR